MHKIRLIILACTAYVSAHAQQVPLYSQFVNNQFALNPAYTADAGHQDFYLGARRQWTQVRSAVETKYLTAQSFTSNGKAGFGVVFVNDQSEFTRKNSLMATYRFKVAFSETNYLNFGLSAGAWDNNFDQSKIYTVDPADPIYQLMSARGGMAFTSNAGVLYRNAGLHLGVSVPNLMQSKTSYGDNYVNVFDFQETRHIVLNAQYDLKASDNFTVSPFVWIKDAGAMLDGQTDFGVTANYRDAIWLSAAYRQHYSVSSQVGMRVGERFTVAYAYDAPIGTYSKALGGSHEMLVGWRIGKSTTPAVESKKIEQPAVDPASKELVEKQNKEINDLRFMVENMEQRQKSMETDLEAAKKVGSTPPESKFPPREETPKPEPVKPTTPVTPPSKPIETETPEVNPSDEFGEFLMITGAFRDQSNATKLIKYLSTKGKTGTYYYDDKSKLHYVYIGKYNSKSKAQEVKEKLAAEGIEVWAKKIK